LHRPDDATANPAPPNQQLDHGHAVPHIGLDPRLPQLDPGHLDLVRVQLNPVEPLAAQRRRDGLVIVPGSLHTHPHAVGAHPMPRRGNGGNELAGTGYSQVELERLSDNLSIVVSD